MLVPPFPTEVLPIQVQESPCLEITRYGRMDYITWAMYGIVIRYSSIKIYLTNLDDITRVWHGWEKSSLREVTCSTCCPVIVTLGFELGLVKDSLSIAGTHMVFITHTWSLAIAGTHMVCITPTWSLSITGTHMVFITHTWSVYQFLSIYVEQCLL